MVAALHADPLAFYTNYADLQTCSSSATQSIEARVSAPQLAKTKQREVRRFILKFNPLPIPIPIPGK